MTTTGCDVDILSCCIKKWTSIPNTSVEAVGKEQRVADGGLSSSLVRVWVNFSSRIHYVAATAEFPFDEVSKNSFFEMVTGWADLNRWC